MKSDEEMRVRVEKEVMQEQRKMAAKRVLEEETAEEDNDPDYQEGAKKTKRPDTVSATM